MIKNESTQETLKTLDELRQYCVNRLSQAACELNDAKIRQKAIEDSMIATIRDIESVAGEIQEASDDHPAD